MTLNIRNSCRLRFVGKPEDTVGSRGVVGIRPCYEERLKSTSPYYVGW